MARLKRVAHFESGTGSDDRADHPFEERVCLEITSARREFVVLERPIGIASVVNLLEKVRRRRHDAEHRTVGGLITVAQALRNRDRRCVRIFTARLKLLVVAIWNGNTWLPD